MNPILNSDPMCDGLGACIGHCPKGAITIESRDAELFNTVIRIKESSCKIVDNKYFRRSLEEVWI